MTRPSLSAIAALGSFLLGLVLLALPPGLLDLTAGSRARWIHAALAGCALWLGLRGMWRNPRATRYLALAGFACATFALIGALVMPQLRRRPSQAVRPASATLAPAPPSAEAPR